MWLKQTIFPRLIDQPLEQYLTPFCGLQKRMRIMKKKFTKENNKNLFEGPLKFTMKMIVNDRWSYQVEVEEM